MIAGKSMEAATQGLIAEDLASRFEKFFRTYYNREILRVVHGYPEERSLWVDYDYLDKYDISLADELISNPDNVIPAAERALRNIDLPVDLPSMKVNVRFHNLPAMHKITIKDIRSEHVGKFMAVEGIVRKATDVRPKLILGAFECQRCGNVTRISQDTQKLKEPFICEDCERRGPFKLLVQESTFVDAQKILIQESLEDLRGGEHPKQLSIYLDDDLAGKITPGDRVELVGILRAVRKVFRDKRSRVFEIYLEANSYRPIELDFEEVKITEEDEKRIIELSKDPLIYEKVRDSIAPHIYGYADIKEAIMYQLFSSPPLKLPDGGRIRGDSHIIIMGEPATGKSEILQYVAKVLAPRGVYASGKGTSAAGLTAAAIKDEFGDGGWSLEAGALVLADKGMACLAPGSRIVVNDEILKIEELFDEKRKIKAVSKGEEIELCDLDLETISLDSDLKTVYSKNSLIRRKIYAGEIFEIAFNSGFKIKLTPDHKLFDGNSLEWKEAREFNKGDFVIAPLKLPGRKKNLHLLDIIPEDWIAVLKKEDKEKLKEKILKKYKNLSEFNKKYSISKDFLSGRSQVKAGRLKKILHEFGCYSEWRKKILGFGRKCAGERLKVAKITPDITYFLGFTYGDGNVVISQRNSAVSITQSVKNNGQIKALKRTFNAFSKRKLGIYKRRTRSIIRGKKVESENIILYTNSNLLAYLYDYFTREKFQNVLKLSDESLKAFIAGCLDSDGCISIKRNKGYEVVHVEFQLSSDEERDQGFILALRRFDCFAKLVKGKRINRVVITGRKDIQQLLKAIGKYSVKARNIPLRKHKVSSVSNKLPAKLVAKICNGISSSVSKTLLIDSGLWSTIYAYKNKRYQPSREQLLKIENRLSRLLSPELKEKIQLLASRDYFLDRIVEIRKLNYSGYVYDLHVPRHYNFLCNGILVHNCIDEFDKMEKEDRGAMHEAMEQQSVSIAKAGILATFRARCSILAAANPKFGRFDDYRAISEQVNLPPTILSRFDLIFFVRDVLEETREVARHILNTAISPTELVPKIAPELLRKYIAYARQKIMPVLTEDARDRIEQFYVEMREMAKDAEDVPIPLTARQLWAILRIARAASRVRLSNETTIEEVERAIRLVKVSLKQAGMDLETGRVDIDKIMVGVTKSQRDRITRVLEMIREIEKEYGSAKKSEIIERAMEEGISEREAEKAIEKLRADGHIYDPKRDERYKVV